MNINKKVDMFFWDCHSSIEIEHNSETDFYTLTVTEHEIDQENSTEHETKLKRSSVTEMYVGAGEIDALINALKYIRKQPEQEVI